MNEIVKDIKREVQRSNVKVEDLVKTVEPLIYSMYKKYKYATDSFEDAYQDSVVILLDSIESFDEEKKLPFVMHYRNCLFYHYMDNVKKRKKDNNRKENYNFDECQEFLPDESSTFETRLILKEDLDGLKESMCKLGDKQLWILMEVYINEKKLVDLAKEKGMHKQSLVKLKKRALDNLRKHLTNGGEIKRHGMFH